MCVRPLRSNCSQRCTCTGCMLLLPPFYYRPVLFFPKCTGWVVVWDTCTHWHSHTHTQTLYVSHHVPTAMSCAVAVACVLAQNLEPTYHGLPTQHPHATPCDACIVAHKETQAGEKKESQAGGENMTSFASWSTRLLPPERSPPLPAFARSRPCVGCTHHIVKSIRHTGNKSIRHTRNSHDCACIGMCEPNDTNSLQAVDLINNKNNINNNKRRRTYVPCRRQQRSSVHGL